MQQQENCEGSYSVTSGHNLLAKPKMHHKVRLEADKLKECLQKCDSASFEFECISHDCDFTGKVKATEFNQTTKPLIDTIRERLKSFKNTLADPKVVKEIVLVGGSTRLKCVRRVLTETFPGASFKESINPDEAAVYGVAVLAHYSQNGLLKFDGHGFEFSTLESSVSHSDVRPLSAPSPAGHRQEPILEFSERGKSNIAIEPPNHTSSGPFELPVEPSCAKSSSGDTVRAVAEFLNSHKQPQSKEIWEQISGGDVQHGVYTNDNYHRSERPTHEKYAHTRPEASNSWCRARDFWEQMSSKYSQQGGYTGGNYHRIDDIPGIPSKEQDYHPTPNATCSVLHGTKSTPAFTKHVKPQTDRTPSPTVELPVQPPSGKPPSGNTRSTSHETYCSDAPPSKAFNEQGACTTPKPSCAVSQVREPKTPFTEQGKAQIGFEPPAHKPSVTAKFPVHPSFDKATSKHIVCTTPETYYSDPRPSKPSSKVHIPTTQKAHCIVRHGPEQGKPQAGVGPSGHTAASPIRLSIRGALPGCHVTYTQNRAYCVNPAKVSPIMLEKMAPFTSPEGNASVKPNHSGHTSYTNTNNTSQCCQVDAAAERQRKLSNPKSANTKARPRRLLYLAKDVIAPEPSSTPRQPRS